jgi:hypothetical protein
MLDLLMLVGPQGSQWHTHIWAAPILTVSGELNLMAKAMKGAGDGISAAQVTLCVETSGMPDQHPACLIRHANIMFWCELPHIGSSVHASRHYCPQHMCNIDCNTTFDKQNGLSCI